LAQIDHVNRDLRKHRKQIESANKIAAIMIWDNYFDERGLIPSFMTRTMDKEREVLRIGGDGIFFPGAH
jgi:hypothetical protein